MYALLEGVPRLGQLEYGACQSARYGISGTNQPRLVCSTFSMEAPLLYILHVGGGSIGLLFSISMRLSCKVKTSSHHHYSPLQRLVQFLPCLLLRHHHRPNIQQYERHSHPRHQSHSTNQQPKLYPSNAAENSIATNQIQERTSKRHNPAEEKWTTQRQSNNGGRDGSNDCAMMHLDEMKTSMTDGDEEGGCKQRSYILASVRREHDDHSLPQYNGVIDIPACIIEHFEQKSSEDTTTVLPIHPPAHIQNILLTTKAPDATVAILSVLHRLHPTKLNNIVVMTNGVLAVMEELKQVLAAKGFLIFMIVATTVAVPMRMVKMILRTGRKSMV